MTEPVKIWVVRIEHNEGLDITLHANRLSGVRHLAAYVDEWWHELTRHNHDGNPQPKIEDPEKRIEHYFAMRDDEWWWLGEETVYDLAPMPVITEEPELSDL